MRCVSDSVQCEYEVSVTLYSASVRCVSDKEKCECEVIH